MNPVTRNKGSFIIYLFVWVILSIAQTSFLYFKHNLPLNFAIVDSIIHNFIFAFIGITIWYLVRYNSFKSNNPLKTISTHIVAGTILVSVWKSLSSFIIHIFYDSDSAEMLFLYESNIFRIIIGSFIFGLLILVYYIIDYNDSIKEKIKRESQLNELLKESELNNLKTQINPHFLFNSLNSIGSLTMIAPEKAHDMIIKLSDFLRYSLKNSKQQTTTIEEELNICNLYISIEKIRFGDKLNYISNVDKGLNNFNIPSMMLQPLLENSIKHGVSKSTDITDVVLSIERLDDHILFILSNNYDTEWDRENKGTSTGLKNISQRLHHIYNKKNLMQASKKDGLFVVEIKIPHIS